MSSAADQLSQLSAEEQRALLAKLMQSRASGTKNYPASFAQHRLWFLDQMLPGSPFYNMAAAFRLSGHLNVNVLEHCFQTIIDRHDTLRTTFAAEDGEPVQCVAPRLLLQLPVIDLRHFSTHQQQRISRLLAIQTARKPFDLATGPLLRVALLRLNDQEHVGLLTLHHIICDGWSVGVFLSELTRLYAAYSTGSPSPLPVLPIQYADFAHWQRERLQGELLDAQVAYWRNQLAHVPVLDLPTDHPRPGTLTYRGSYYRSTFPVCLTAPLKSLSQQHGCTLFMTLLSAFAVLLFRYSGQTDIPVGSPIANRTRAELAGLIGFFVNMLVMRMDLADDPPFLEFLSRTKDVALGAFANQDVPFENLVPEIEPRRTLNRTPLFQVAFALQNEPRPEVELSGLTLSPIESDSGTSKFDLTLYLRETPDGLDSTWEYSTDLFDLSTVQRMARHFQTLLKGIVADPNRRLSEIPLLTGEERTQVVSEWNQSRSKFPEARSVVSMYESIVSSCGDRVAWSGVGGELELCGVECAGESVGGCVAGVGGGRGGLRAVVFGAGRGTVGGGAGDPQGGGRVRAVGIGDAAGASAIFAGGRQRPGGAHAAVAAGTTPGGGNAGAVCG